MPIPGRNATRWLRDDASAAVDYLRKSLAVVTPGYREHLRRLFSQLFAMNHVQDATPLQMLLDESG